MQVLVERGSNGVFHGGFYHVCRKPRPQPFAKSGDASAIVLGITSHLTDTGSHHHSRDRRFPERRVFPMFAIGMRLRFRNVSLERYKRKCEDYRDSMHTPIKAIGIPSSCW